MTDNELFIHDEARDNAVDALEALRVLSVEGIPGRIGRVCAELYRIVESCWMLNSAAGEDLVGGCLDADARNGAAIVLRDSSALEAAVVAAMRILKPLGWDNRGIVQLDEKLDLILGHDGKDADIIETFVRIYSDKDRGAKIERLNEIFHKGLLNDDI